MATVEFKVKNIRASDGTSAAMAQVAGSIDATSLVQFQNVMDKLVEKGVKNLILDCSKVKYINSTGLGTLLKYVDIFDSMSGHIAFTRVPSKVMLVMEMLGFNALFNIVGDEAQALRSFSGRPAAAPVQAAAPAAAPAPVAARGAPTLAPAAAPAVEGAAPGFPVTVDCTRCGVGVQIPGSGKFKCPRCDCILSVEPAGRVKFFASKKAQPVQLTIPARPATVTGIVGLVESVARHVGFDGDLVKKIAEAVKTACLNVALYAYDNDESGLIHCLFQPDAGKLVVRISDYGKAVSFEGGSVASDERFAEVAGVMDSVEHVANPKGGNIFKLVKGL